MIGKDKFDEEIKLLKEIDSQSQEKGIFKPISGNIDTRSNDKLDVQLDDGYQTQCGIKGGKLSGGQKQRVAIARTIVRNPKVLLLDEATSALDEDSQNKIQEALDNIKIGRTMIIIAHRLSTIEKCNKIFVLESGKVVEEGTFQVLKEAGGFFSKLTSQH